MENYLNILSFLILFSVFALVANKRVKAYINTFRIQSVFIAIVVGILGVKSFRQDGALDIIFVCLIIIALKVIYIPILLNKTYTNVEYKVEKDFFFNIPLHIFICCILVIFSYFSFSNEMGKNPGQISVQTLNAISIILIGMFFMISRKKAIGQIVGFLVIENGLFLAAVFSSHGMPFLVDVGIFIDLITAVLVMGIIVIKINEKFQSIDMNLLKKLRG